jgi:EpsI family protein
MNRTLLTDGKRQWIMYFWFRCRGRNLVNAYELKFFNFWDRLIKRRTDGALIRAMTPITDSEARGDAEQRIQELLSLIVPIIDTHLPK